MAEGTYGSPYYQQIVSPTEPNTPATKFATSVTRKKTRKWVEAKKINYDGSGWGDDDDDDDEEYEDEPAPAAAGPAHNAPLALPSQQSSLPSTILSRNPSPNPSLHLQTQPPTSSSPSLPSQSLPSQSLPSQQPWRQGSPAPSFTSDTASGVVSPRSGALPAWRDGRAESPLGPRGQSPANSAGPNGPRAFVRPSEIYKRSIGQDEPPASKAVKAVELPAAPAPAPAPKAAPPSAPVELPAAAVEPVIAPTITPMPQPTVQPTSPAVVETVIEAPVITTEADTEATGTVADANGERRFSSSPKLPDLARFSMFSPDLLFGGSNFLSSDTPPVPSMPGAAAPSVNKEVSKEAAQPKLASVAEDVDRTSGTASPFSTSSIKSGSAIRDSAATAATASSLADGLENNSVGGGKSALSRAAEPEADKAIEEVEVEREEPVATASPDYSAGQIAPLKPNRASQMFLPSVSLPMAPMGPRGLERTSTADTVSASVTSSPVKESDMLSDEIIRTLSPVKSAHSAHSDISQIVNEPNTTAATTTETSEAVAKPEDERAVAEPTRTLTRESTYLSDVYDDYWSPEDGSGHEAYTPPPVPPLSTASIPATATAPAEPVAVPAMTESPEMTTASPYNLPSQTQQVPPLVNSPSPAASFGIAPAPALSPAPAVAAVASAVPTSVSSAPGTRSSSSATTRNLRRRFSWEAEPESSPSPVMAPSEPAISPAAQESQPPVLDPKASISAVSVVSAAQESLSSPSPLSEAPTSATERPVTQAPAPTQAPVRSMLDVGDDKPEKPKLRSMLSFDDVPTPTPAAAAAATVATPTTSTAPAAPTAPVPAVEDVSSPTAAGVNRGSVADSTRSAQSAQSVQSPLPVAPSSAQSNDGPGGLGGVNPAMYGSGNEGTAQFLTLRQCMAFGTHSERMAKLTETRREYSLAESGLSGWLTNMTVMPEYSRASYAPLWDGPLTVPPPTSRPAAAAVAVAAIAHVPHVNISSSQISHKSKEIFGVAAGKAGKGLLALRKKGFHKKSAN